MQKLESKIKDFTLESAIKKLEDKVSILLNLYEEQVKQISQLKKENILLKKQLSIKTLYPETDEKLKIKLNKYIEYINKCIEYIETKTHE